MSARAYLFTSKGTHYATTAKNEILIGSYGTVVRAPCVQRQFRMIVRMQAQVQLNNLIGKFCRDGDHERAPPRTLKVGAFRNGTIVGPVPNRPNRSGTATLPNGKLR